MALPEHDRKNQYQRRKKNMKKKVLEQIQHVAHQDGYDKGYEAGYQDGVEIGNKDGFEAGYARGTEATKLPLKGKLQLQTTLEAMCRTYGVSMDTILVEVARLVAA